tara:strand:+ start:500 stop:1300 length:801 start_codon:yes stop_codon:yes gene_type:complete
MLRSQTQNNEELCSIIDPNQVVEMGTGSNVILFLHGLFGTPEHWQQVMDNLSDRYRVVAPQLPIDPHPDRRKKGMKTISDLSGMVLKLIDNLQADSLVICGNSLGGLVAIDLCLNNPDLAKGLVLAGSAGLFERSPIRGLRQKPSKQFVRETVCGILHDHSLVSDDLVEHWHRSVLDRDYARFLLRVSRATRDRCVEKELGNLALPTMIVWGRNDEITPPSTGEEFQRHIKGSRLEFIEECGHAPNWERPDAFVELLDEFLPECFS